jgi:hypothetical protein
MQTFRSLMHLAALAALCLGTLASPPSAVAQDTQFGKVIGDNNYDGWVTVRLYHADALDRVFGSWTFRSFSKTVGTGAAAHGMTF